MDLALKEVFVALLGCVFCFDLMDDFVLTKSECEGGRLRFAATMASKQMAGDFEDQLSKLVQTGKLSLGSCRSAASSVLSVGIHDD